MENNPDEQAGIEDLHESWEEYRQDNRIPPTEEEIEWQNDAMLQRQRPGISFSQLLPSSIRLQFSRLDR